MCSTVVTALLVHRVSRLDSSGTNENAGTRDANLGPMSIGVDEVGRGAWAGPLVVGAASGDIEAASQILRRRDNDGYYDSKALSPQRRSAMAARLVAAGLVFGLGSATAHEIDAEGLTKALSLAAGRALVDLGPQLVTGIEDHQLLLDGAVNYLADAGAVMVVRGDRTHPLIAAASIAAKLARDEWMIMLDAELPFWDFRASKGYGSPRHRFGLSWLGPSVEHRRSFRPMSELQFPGGGHFSSAVRTK